MQGLILILGSDTEATLETGAKFKGPGCAPVVVPVTHQ